MFSDHLIPPNSPFPFISAPQDTLFWPPIQHYSRRFVLHFPTFSQNYVKRRESVRNRESARRKSHLGNASWAPRSGRSSKLVTALCVSRLSCSLRAFLFSCFFCCSLDFPVVWNCRCPFSELASDPIRSSVTSSASSWFPFTCTLCIRFSRLILCQVSTLFFAIFRKRI